MGGWSRPLLGGGHIYLLEVVSSESISPLLDISAKVIPTESWDVRGYQDLMGMILAEMPNSREMEPEETTSNR